MRWGLTAVAVACLAALSVCGTDSGVTTTGQAGLDESGTTIGDGVTTTEGVPTTEELPTTVLDETTTTVAAETTTTDTTVADTTVPDTEPEDPGIPVTGSGTEWRSGPEEGDPEVVTSDTDCASFFAALAAGPYVVSECGEWNAVGGTRVWTVTQGASGRWVAVVWQEHAPDAWIPLLRLIENEPGTWSGVTLLTDNIDSGPNDELVSGIRIVGTGQYLTVEIIDIRSDAPRVVARVPDLHKGSAKLEPAGVYVYSADLEGPECCPASFDESLLASTDDGWVLLAGASGISPDAVPPSDL